MPVEALGRTFAFGEAESGDEAIAPSVEGERAGDDDGDMDGMTSSDDVDSKRVEAALLAGDSQHTRQSRRTGNGDLPVSSMPPIYPADRPYGPVRWRRRRGRIKITSIIVSQTLQVETTYLGRAGIAQPRGNHPKRAYRVIGPKH